MTSDPLGLGRYAQPGDLVNVRGLGMTQRVEGDRLARGGRRLDELELRAEKDGEHLWVITTCHLVTDIDTHLRGDGLLDAESLLTGGIGCYVCEQPYTTDLRTTRCPGQPS